MLVLLPISNSQELWLRCQKSMFWCIENMCKWKGMFSCVFYLFIFLANAQLPYHAHHITVQHFARISLTCDQSQFIPSRRIYYSSHNTDDNFRKILSVSEISNQISDLSYLTPCLNTALTGRLSRFQFPTHYSALWREYRPEFYTDLTLISISSVKAEVWWQTA